MFLRLALLFFPCVLFSSVYITFTDDPARSVDVVTIDELFTPELSGTKMHTERARYEGHVIEHAHFKHLSPNSEYTVRIGKRRVRFKTLPDTVDNQPLRIVICGDVYKQKERCVRGLDAIAKKAPDAVVVGGDIAYTRGHMNLTRGVRFETKRWIQFFELWDKHMRTPEGLAIPLLPCVGNHDVRPKDAFGKRGKAFYAFFPQLRHTYYSLPLANHVRLICLDTGHSEPIEGKQTEYVKKALSQSNEPFKIACYHIPAYPSYTSFTNGSVTKVRELWCPLFDAAHLQAAFEHDNHTFKRTKKIAQEKEAKKGTFYFGDGCLGVRPRNPGSNGKRWYLEKVSPTNHYFLLTAEKDGTHVQAIDLEDTVIDSVQLEKQ